MSIDITDLTAALFKNDYKEKDSQPDFVGKVSHKETKEQLYRISAWKNKSKEGKAYLSLRFSELNIDKPKPSATPDTSFVDDDINF